MDKTYLLLLILNWGSTVNRYGHNRDRGSGMWCDSIQRINLVSLQILVVKIRQMLSGCLIPLILIKCLWNSVISQVTLIRHSLVHLKLVVGQLVLHLLKLETRILSNLLLRIMHLKQSLRHFICFLNQTVEHQLLCSLSFEIVDQLFLKPLEIEIVILD